MRFDHYTLEDGLSQSTIIDMHQSPMGYLWIATQDGLNRYDGIQFDHLKHDPNDPNSISANFVTSLAQGDGRSLWVGTHFGLNHYSYENRRWRRYYSEEGVPSSLTHNHVTALLRTRSGSLWVGTDQGLNRYLEQNGRFEPFFLGSRDDYGSANNSIRTLAEDLDGTIWIGTESGLARLDPTSSEIEPVLLGSIQPGGEPEITSIYVKQNGEVWVGTIRQGLFRFINQEGEWHPEHHEHLEGNPDSPPHNHVTSFFEEPDGTFWVGTQNGLSRFDSGGGHFVTYRHSQLNPHGLNDSFVTSILMDRTRVLWVGTRGNGLNRSNYKNTSFTLYSHDASDPQSLSSNAPWSIYEDRLGQIWIGMLDTGLNLLTDERGEFRNFRHDPANPNSISSNEIKMIGEDSEGRLLLGAIGSGVDRFDPENGRVVERLRPDPENPQTIQGDRIWAIETGPGGGIWFGDMGEGLSRMDPESGRFDFYRHDPGDPTSLVSNRVTMISFDRQGVMWVGTEEGISRFDRENGTFRSWSHDPEVAGTMASGPVTFIQEDRGGRYWVGTYGGGLNRFDPDDETFIRYGAADGLINDNPYAMLEDDEGMLWISSNRGLHRLDPATMEFQNFGMTDGLQSYEFNFGAYHRTREGKLYFGGVGGVNAFLPSQVEQNPYPPEVVFTGFKLFNVPVGYDEFDGRVILERCLNFTEEVTLHYNENVVTFEFAALHFAHPRQNSYAYMLEGLEEKWNYVGNRTFATYTSLPAGEYTFRVKAANYSGLWNEEGAAVRMVITPPFWQTLWFYLLAVLMVGGGAVGFFSWRVSRFIEQNRTLEVEVQNRTGELHNRNRELQEALVLLNETRDELVEKAHKAGMAEIATGVLHNVGNVLNSITTSASQIEELVHQSSIGNWFRSVELMKSNKSRLHNFLTEDPKGQLLLDYLPKLEELIRIERQELLKNQKRLVEKVKLINEIIEAQQSIASAGSLSEEIELDKLVEDTVMLFSESIDRHNIQVELDLSASRPVRIARSKVMHVLINLIENARDALGQLEEGREKVITIHIERDSEETRLIVSDNGKGIPEENLNRVFQHGFTTKHDGHGFGLHSSANYMTEMGGELRVRSEGHGAGASFILSFPLISADE
ncbi:MAG: two-component regulator propeller domain-containing protein [Balneolaceae bacterium]